MLLNELRDTLSHEETKRIREKHYKKKVVYNLKNGKRFNKQRKEIINEY